MDDEHFTKKVIPIIVAVVMFMEFMDTSILNTAIPSISRSFHETPLLMKFAVTSYLISLALFIPISGWCTDKFGTKKVFILSVLLFVVSSFFCGISKNILELSVCRFFQGMGGAFMNPVSRTIVVRLFPPKDLVRVQAFIFTPALAGYIVGPFVGGMITTYSSWPLIFFINIPIGLITIYCGSLWVKNEFNEHVGPLDWKGFLLSMFSLGLLAFSFDMIGHEEIIPKFYLISVMICGVLLFLFFIFHCLHFEKPILNLNIFKVKTFRIGVSVNFFTNLGYGGISFLLPLLFQEQFKMSAVKSGTLILPMAFGSLINRILVTKTIKHIGFKRSIILGLAMIFISILLISEIQAQTSLLYIIVSEFILGVGIVTLFASVGALNYVDLSKKDMANATAIDMTVRQFAAGTAVVISALCLNFFSKIYGTTISTTGSVFLFQYALYVPLVFILVSYLISLKLSVQDGLHASNHNVHKLTKH